MASVARRQRVVTGRARPGALMLRPTDDARSWDDLVSGHPDATPFHLSSFLTTAAGLLDLRVDLTVVEQDGEVVGAVPLLIRRIEPFGLVNHRLPFPYFGPLLSPRCSLDDVLVAVRQYLRPRPLLHFGVQAVRPFPLPGRLGWECSLGRATLVVPTGDKDDDELLAMISKSQRGTLRRAERAGVTAGTATRTEVAEYLGAWAAVPFARQGLPARWPSGAHLAFYDALAPSGVCRAIAVRRDGELLAVSTDLAFGKRLIGWEIGISDSGRAVGAASVLEFAAMRLARVVGAVELDLLGAVTPGQAAFKRSFGAEPRPLGAVRWASHLLHWGKRLRSLVPPS
jgi:CelD/BcsL family acetyltransferase involved in cellulose biosynthesis